METMIQKTNFSKLNINKTGIVLFCLYVFLSYICNDLILSSAINSIVLYVFVIYSILYTILQKKLRITSMAIWMVLFMGYSMITMIYSPEKNILSGQFYLLIVNFVLIALLSQYNISVDNIRQIGWTHAIASTCLILMLILSGNIHDLSESGRLGTELLGNANLLASMLMMAALYTMWLLIYTSTSKIYRFFLIVFLAIQYYGIFLCGGRKYVVIPLIFLFLLFFFKKDSKGKTHMIKYTIILILVSMLLFYLIMEVPALYNIIGIRFEGFISFLKGDLSDSDSSTIVRYQMIQAGIIQWLKNPIFGYGFDSFKYYNLDLTGRFYYSHNNFVELLYNEGGIGFLLYYSFYVLLFRKSLRKSNTRNLSVRAFTVACIISMLIYEVTAINYTATQTMIMLCLLSRGLQVPNIRLGNN